MINPKYKTIFISIIFFSFLALAQSAEAACGNAGQAECYVDDTIAADCSTYDVDQRACGTGGTAKAYKTIQAAASAVNEGDTVHIRAGTHKPFNVAATTDGTSESRITFKSYSGEIAIVDSDEDYTINTFGVAIRIDGDYITLDGLEVTHSSPNKDLENFDFSNKCYEYLIADQSYSCTGYNAGYTVSGVTIYGDYVYVKNCNIHDMGGTGVYTDPTGARADYAVIENNTIHHNGWSKTGHGIYAAGLYHTIKDNDIHGNFGLGAQSYGPASTHFIYNNKIYNNGIAGASYSKYYHLTEPNDASNECCLYTPKSRCQGKTYHSPNGYKCGWEGNTMGYYLVAGSSQFYNNLLYDNNNFGLNVQVGSKIVGNTIYNSDGMGMYVKPNTGIIVKNNIIMESQSNDGYVGDVNYDYATGNTISNNLIQKIGSNPNELFEDPAFRDISSHDFRLSQGSLAIDAGACLTTTNGSGSSNTISVANASMFPTFYYGYSIMIGANTVTITNSNNSNNTITIDNSIAWINGECVHLPHNGLKPDIGAYEYVPENNDITPPASPSGLSVN